MYSMQGLPTTGTMGLGWLLVSGRRRVPSPPAMTTARTDLTFPRRLRGRPGADGA